MVTSCSLGFRVGELFSTGFFRRWPHLLPSRPPVPAFEGVNSERDDDLMKWRVDD